MPRRRPPRVGPSTDHQSVRDVTKGESPGRSDRKLGISTTCILLFAVVFPAISLMLYSRVYSSKMKMSTYPDSFHAYRNGFVNTEMNYRQVLTEHMKFSENSDRRNFSNPVLAYITPWNSQGYEMARKYNSKFTHLSPVWYELKSADNNLFLEGRHNVDKEWILEVRRTGSAQVLPRIAWEINPVNFLKKKKQWDKAIDLVVKECEDMGFDGIVLESWSRWAAYGVLHDQNMRNMALQFIKKLGVAMHSIASEESRNQSLQLIYVIGPPRSNELKEYDFGPEDFQVLSDAVDGFSLMTYDFSGPQNPGPNAPIKWIHSTLQVLLDASTGDHHHKFSKKLFLGINFYGNDFVASGGGGPIVGREYLSLLEQHRPDIRWEESIAEHYFVYHDNQNMQHVVFYPTPMSIAQRLQAALSWGTGISIWEIGQGLEYFFDIL